MTYMSTQVEFGHIPERTLGRRLRDAREDTGMSQEAFAKAVGVGRRTVTRYESATSVDEVKRSAMLAWSMVSRVPLSWLETGESHDPSGGGVTPPLVRGRSRFAQHAFAIAA